MRLSPEQLQGHLGRGLAPVYLVYGDEPLQMRESLDAIRATAKTQGFLERQVFDVERGFDWSSLRAEADSLSLFATKRFLELRLAGKPGEPGAKALRQYADKPSPQVVLLISVGKLDQASQRSAWVKALDGAGVVVQTRPVDRARLRAWIRQRAAAGGLQISQEAGELLADRSEGNMLACAQEIDKLGLLYAPGSVDLEQALVAVYDNARYTLFALADSTLAGDSVRCARILASLRAEGTEPTLVIWALGRELRLLCQMAHDLGRGDGLEKAIAARKVWESRKGLFRQALKRQRPESLLELLRGLGRADRIAKGADAGDAWTELAHLSLRLAGEGAAVPLHQLH